MLGVRSHAERVAEQHGRLGGQGPSGVESLDLPLLGRSVTGREARVPASSTAIHRRLLERPRVVDVAVDLDRRVFPEQDRDNRLGELAGDADHLVSHARSGRLADEHDGVVAASASSARNACRQVMPPTSALRSRPPSPIAWDTPPPSRSICTMTSCSPVPEAPTRPIDPS